MKGTTTRLNRGFTLVELLVVMGIISTLVAISLPRYATYRAHAYDSQAEMDVRSVAMAEEAYFLANDTYLACAGADCSSLPGIQRISNGVTLGVTTSETGFIITASHGKGSGKTFTWDSDRGGF